MSTDKVKGGLAYHNMEEVRYFKFKRSEETLDRGGEGKRDAEWEKKRVGRGERGPGEERVFLFSFKKMSFSFF
jgi:hypothetical protein